MVITSVDSGDSSVVPIRGRAIEPLANVRRTIAGKQVRDGAGEPDREAYFDDLLAVVVREGASGERPRGVRARVPQGAAQPSARGEGSCPREADPGLSNGRIRARRRGRAAPLGPGRARSWRPAWPPRRRRWWNSSSGPWPRVPAQRWAAGRSPKRSKPVRSRPRSYRTSFSRTRRLPASSTSPGRVAADLLVRADEAAGKKLTALGGIAAVLRYDWTSLGRTTGSPGSPRAAPRTDASGP